MNVERWNKFSQRDQLGHIGSDILRISNTKDQVAFAQMLESVIELVDLSLQDPKWQENPLPLLVLRNEFAKAYTGERVDFEKLYGAL